MVKRKKLTHLEAAKLYEYLKRERYATFADIPHDEYFCGEDLARHVNGSGDLWFTVSASAVRALAPDCGYRVGRKPASDGSAQVADLRADIRKLQAQVGTLTRMLWASLNEVVATGDLEQQFRDMLVELTDKEDDQ